MITADRFIARSSDREAWLWARSQGVTATAVSKAASGPAGFRDVIDAIDNPREIEANRYMAWGSEREAYISMTLKDRFADYGLMPNDWLISRSSTLDRWQMATPDMLSLDHTLIGEIKTGGKPAGPPSLQYQRQMQWQMFVCGSQPDGTQIDRCLYAYERRFETPEGFAPDFDIYTEWVDRDDDIIADLIAVAEQVQQHNVYRSWDEREELENI